LHFRLAALSLIKAVEEVARAHLKLVNGGDETWEEVWGSVLNEEISKDYFTRSTPKVFKHKAFNTNNMFG
jgi:hypothetical protein